MLLPLPRRSHWRYRIAHQSSDISLPRKGHRVGLHIGIFEACSAFTRVTACTLAWPPNRGSLNRRLQPFRFLHGCSGASGWSSAPGGIRTHWKAPPLHGARHKPPYNECAVSGHSTLQPIRCCLSCSAEANVHGVRLVARESVHCAPGPSCFDNHLGCRTKARIAAIVCAPKTTFARIPGALPRGQTVGASAARAAAGKESNRG